MFQKRNVVWRIPSSGKIEENRSLRVFVTQIKVGAYCWTPSPLKLQFLPNLRQNPFLVFLLIEGCHLIVLVTKYQKKIVEKFIINLSKLLCQIDWIYIMKKGITKLDYIECVYAFGLRNGHFMELIDFL